MSVTLKSLGLTREEILGRVVDRLVERMLGEAVYDTDGEADTTPTKFARALRVRVQTSIDKAVEDIAGQHVLPNVAAYVESLCLQETNRWGEKTGRPVTFIEYLVQRAENYLREEVDHDGKTRAESQTSFWSKRGTRIAYMVHEHLQYSIKTAMEQALKTANAAIVGGIENAVKIKLAEVAAALKVEVKSR